MAQDEPVSRNEELQREMAQLSGRDLQLWLLAVLMLLVLAGGVIVVVLPSLLEDLRQHAGGRYLPQLFGGLVVLIALFNAYVLDQRRRLTKARQELVHQMIINERTQHLTLIDPLTEIFNRRYMDQVVPREMSRADRLGSALTMVLTDLDEFKGVNDRFGHAAGDKLLVDVAQLLQRTFRACDIVLRFGGDEFLILLPDTAGKEAQRAVERLQQQVARWNGAASRDFTLALSCGIAQYRKGEEFDTFLRRADERMYADKERHKNANARAATTSRRPLSSQTHPARLRV